MTLNVARLVELENQIQTLRQSVKELVQDFREAKKQTDRFLKIAAKAGCTKVGICRQIEEKKWPFSSHGSVFGDGEGTAIWKPVHALNIWGGCSNGNQAQIRYEAQLIEGVYELKDGKWNKVKD